MSTSNLTPSNSPYSSKRRSSFSSKDSESEKSIKLKKHNFAFESFRKINKLSNSPAHNTSVSNLSNLSSEVRSRPKIIKSTNNWFFKYFIKTPLKYFLKFCQSLKNPELRIATVWILFQMIIAAYNYIGITFRCTFLYTYRFTWYSNPLEVGILAGIDIFFDFILLFDLFLGFLTPYFGDDGVLIFDVKKTALRYLSPRKGWFLIDLITVIPLDWIPLIIFEHWVPYFRLNKSFRLIFKFLHYFSHFENYVNISSSITRIIKFICVVLLITHSIACVWYLVSISEEPQNTIMWTNIESLPYRKIWEIYIYAFHWCLLSMIGYGGTISASLKQVVFSEIVVGIGVTMFVTVIGTLGSLVTNLDSNSAKNRQRLDEIKLYMKYRKLPSYLTSKIINYYTFLFKSRKGWDEEKILNDLPQYLRVEVALDMNRKIVEKVELFKNSSRMFIGSVVLSLMPRMTLPGTAIVRRGEIGREMYFIASGCVNILSPKDDKTVLVKLREGSFFGEIALIYDSLRVCTVVADTYCDLYVLTKEAFNRIEEDYPDQVRRIRELAAKRKEGQKPSSNQNEEKKEDQDQEKKEDQDENKSKESEKTIRFSEMKSSSNDNNDDSNDNEDNSTNKNDSETDKDNKKDEDN